MEYKIALGTRQERVVVVAGCGGTGGFVAEGLCRILPESTSILLIDHDRVEPPNLKRQNFYPGDVGKFKSQALAERLSQLYKRKIGYSIIPYDRDLINRSVGFGMAIHSAIIIGCVDNPAARTKLTDLHYDDWWIDSGNGFHSGQVLIGNTIQKELLKTCFDEGLQLVNRLPAPSMQLPGLLAPIVSPVPRRNCAEAVEAEEQSPVINQVMATLVLDFVWKLLRGELTWMGVYIDMESGTLSPVTADPVTVARMLRVRLDSLYVHEKDKMKGRS